MINYRVKENGFDPIRFLQQSNASGRINKNIVIYAKRLKY